MISYTDSDLSSSVGDVRQGTSSRSAPQKYSVAKNTIHGRRQRLRPPTESRPEMQSLSPERGERLENWISQQEAVGFTPTHAEVRVLVARLAQDQKERRCHRGKKRKYRKQLLKRHTDADTKLGRRTESARAQTEAREIIQKLVKTIDSHRAGLLLQKQELISLRAQLDEVRPRKKRKVQTDPNGRFAPFAAILGQRGSTAENGQDTEDGSVVVGERDGVIMPIEEGAPPYSGIFARARTRYYLDLSSEEEGVE